MLMHKRPTNEIKCLNYGTKKKKYDFIVFFNFIVLFLKC